jgi:hypothetical protein
MNITPCFFETSDEDWKGNPNDPLGAEKHRGLFTIDRKLSLALREFWPNLKSVNPVKK